MTHYINSEHLTIDRVEEILVKGYNIALSDDAVNRINHCREYLDKKMDNAGRPIYGVTTGFGSLCNISVDKENLSQLQKNLMMSHACGTGARVPKDIARLMLLLKVQSLSYGHSGVQLVTVQRLVDMFNNNIIPVVYEQGSLGASGDLSPLAHMCLPLLGLGEVEVDGNIISGEDLMQRMGWQPITLCSKEGLALLNGTQFMQAYGVYSLINARRLSRWADHIGAMSLDAFDGRIEPFEHNVHAIRPHAGQIETAKNIREILDGSEIVKQPKKHVQDPYSFRCIPQVHGEVISAGNFHGQPIALAMDFLAIAVAELANISERRIYKIISGARGLPHFLVANPGLNSGFMIPQYTAASIVSQSKGLCWPASCDSIPSSQGQEDHVSMGSNAATKLWKVVQNSERVLAIELMNAAQALEFRRPMRSSETVEAIFEAYRKVVPFVDNDTVMFPHIASSVKFLNEYELAR